MSEAAIVTAIIREIRARGGWVVKTTGVAVAGTPDLIGSYRSVALAWEIKQPGNHPTPRQRYELGRAALAGASAHVLRSRAEAAEILDRIDQTYYTR